MNKYSLDQAHWAAREMKRWITLMVQVNAWSADLLIVSYIYTERERRKTILRMSWTVSSLVAQGLRGKALKALAPETSIRELAESSLMETRDIFPLTRPYPVSNAYLLKVQYKVFSCLLSSPPLEATSSCYIRARNILSCCGGQHFYWLESLK